MKVKIIWAYTDEPSITIRLSIKSIVELIQKIPTSHLKRLFKGVRLSTDTFGDDARRDELNKLIK